MQEEKKRGNGVMSTLPGAQQSLLQHMAEAVVVVAMLGCRQSRGAHS